MNLLRKKSETTSNNAFISLDKAQLRDAVSFTMKWGKIDDEVITWKILSDSEFVKADDGPLTYSDVVEFGFEEKRYGWPHWFFFKYIFLVINGKLNSVADCCVCHFATSMLIFCFVQVYRTC
jgi:hypothetical protein